MVSHVKALGVFYIVLGGLSVLAGVIVLLVFGGIVGLLGMGEPGEGARIAIPLLGSVGGLVFVALAIFSIPGIVAGFGLLNFRPWARTLALVLSGINILNFPFGSLLGAYGLWVLLQVETERLFGIRGSPAVRS